MRNHEFEERWVRDRAYDFRGVLLSDEVKRRVCIKCGQTADDCCPTIDGRPPRPCDVLVSDRVRVAQDVLIEAGFEEEALWLVWKDLKPWVEWLGQTLRRQAMHRWIDPVDLSEREPDILVMNHPMRREGRRERFGRERTVRSMPNVWWRQAAEARGVDVEEFITELRGASPPITRRDMDTAAVRILSRRDEVIPDLDSLPDES